MVSWLTFEPFHVSALNQPLLLGDLAPSLERLRDLYLSMRHSHCPCSHCFQASQQSRKHNVCVFSRVWLFVTPWPAGRQASVSITNSRGLLKLMSIESVMPSNHLIFCHPLLLLPSIFPIIFYYRCWGRYYIIIRFQHLIYYRSLCNSNHFTAVLSHVFEQY